MVVSDADRGRTRRGRAVHHRHTRESARWSYNRALLETSADIAPDGQHGIPGVLKNALDWLSRPPGESVMQGKPVAAMGASPSPVGTARAQLQLRRTLLYLGADIVAKPEVLVSGAGEKIENGRLVDEDSLHFLERLLETFDEHIRKR